jgi:hypothetical protein
MHQSIATELVGQALQKRRYFEFMKSFFLGGGGVSLKCSGSGSSCGNDIFLL